MQSFKHTHIQSSQHLCIQSHIQIISHVYSHTHTIAQTYIGIDNIYTPPTYTYENETMHTITHEQLFKHTRVYNCTYIHA